MSAHCQYAEAYSGVWGKGTGYIANNPTAKILLGNFPPIPL